MLSLHSQVSAPELFGNLLQAPVFLERANFHRPRQFWIDTQANDWIGHNLSPL
jgi:hypothetical protein